MSQIEDLQYILLTNSLTGMSDEPITSDDIVLSDPVANFFEKSAFDAEMAGQTWGWNEPLIMAAHAGPSDDSLAKRDTRADEERFIKNRFGISGPFGSSAAAPRGGSLAKVEERTIGNDRWQYSYDDRGELIDAHVVNTDGGRLQKSADERDLSKASSGPGRIRFEKTMIPGEDGRPEEWICGYDHTGECVRSMPLADHEQIHKYSEQALET